MGIGALPLSQPVLHEQELRPGKPSSPAAGDPTSTPMRSVAQACGRSYSDPAAPSSTPASMASSAGELSRTHQPLQASLS
nr:unnamed protein product [Digitaria exilis]